MPKIKNVLKLWYQKECQFLYFTNTYIGIGELLYCRVTYFLNNLSILFVYRVRYDP